MVQYGDGEGQDKYHSNHGGGDNTGCGCDCDKREIVEEVCNSGDAGDGVLMEVLEVMMVSVKMK